MAALTVAVNHYFETTGRRVFLAQWWEIAADLLATVEGPMIHAEEAETSIALALGHRVLMERATRDAWDRGAAVRDAGHPWTSLGKYGMRHSGGGGDVPMDMLRDITPSGVVGDATRAIGRDRRAHRRGDRAPHRPGRPRDRRDVRPTEGDLMARRVIDLTQPLSRESQLHPFFPSTQILRHIQHTDARPATRHSAPRSSSPRTTPQPTSTPSRTTTRARMPS